MNFKRERHSPRGNSLVEFVLVFPFLVLTIGLLFEGLLLGFEQMALQRDCIRFARFYSISHGRSLVFKIPTDVQVLLTAVPAAPAPNPVKQKHEPFLAMVTLSRKSSLTPFEFPLQARVTELFFPEVGP